MKTLLLTLLVSGISTSFAVAQNNVTVTQNGSGNSVLINQGTEEQYKPADCTEAKIKTEGNNNTIKVSKGTNKQETVLHQSNMQRNDLSALLVDLHMLETLQEGDANSIFVILPDSGTAPHTLTATQHGRANTFSAQLTSETGNAFVSQSGEGNSIEINPCESNKHP